MLTFAPIGFLRVTHVLYQPPFALDLARREDILSILERIVRSLELNSNWRALKLQGCNKLVLQVALVGVGNGFRLVTMANRDWRILSTHMHIA